MSGAVADPARVILYISPTQKRQVLAGLPPDVARFDLDTGSFTVPGLPHVDFWPVITPDTLRNLKHRRDRDDLVLEGDVVD